MKANIWNTSLPYDLHIKQTYNRLVDDKEYCIYGNVVGNEYNIPEQKYLKSIATGNDTWVIFLMDENDNALGYDEVSNDIINSINDLLINPVIKGVDAIEINSGISITSKK